MKTSGTMLLAMTLLTVFVSLGVFLGSLVLTDHDSEVKTFESDGRQFDKIASDVDSLKDFSETSGENIIQKIEVQDFPLKAQEYWDEVEIVTIDVEEFENTAANGNVSLKLFERDFEVQIEEISRLNGGKSYRYSGYVEGIPQSKATFYVYGELFSGSIEFEDLTYNIAVTSEKDDGETVHVVFITDLKKDRERVKHLLNPLTYLT